MATYESPSKDPNDTRNTQVQPYHDKMLTHHTSCCMGLDDCVCTAHQKSLSASLARIKRHNYLHL